MRAVTPALSSSLFALSVDKGVAGGYLVWFFMIGVGLALVCSSRFLIDAQPEWRKQKGVDNDENG